MALSSSQEAVETEEVSGSSDFLLCTPLEVGSKTWYFWTYPVFLQAPISQ